MRVLDLFCGAGGAAMGLHWAWPDAEIIGVDIAPQPRYPFTFIQGDWRSINPADFDFIWASPPCQGYSHLTPKLSRDNHPRLIEEVRAVLTESGILFCIENVAGARMHLRSPFMLCGSMFGLKSFRHRFFEASFSVAQPNHPKHDFLPLLVTTASKASRAIRRPGEYKSVKNAPMAYGIDWMNFNGLKEAIPPAYSKYIAEQFMKGHKGD